MYIIVHRKELQDQILRTLAMFNCQCQVLSVKTLVRRLGVTPEPDLLIIDEAHHCAEGNTWGKILDHWKCMRIGVTATPIRLSGESLGRYFDTLIMAPQMRTLIDQGHLCDFKIYAPPTVDTRGLHVLAGEYNKKEVNERVNKPKITGDVIEHYTRLANGKRFIAFCPSVEFAHRLAEEFTGAGIATSAVDGGMSDTDRRRTIERFSEGSIVGLTSCNLVEEGFDVPAIECGMLLAPTMSISRYRQQVGRLLRSYPGKRIALIFDHVGNVERHGFPDEPIEWSLEPKQKRKRNTEDRPTGVRVCLNCYACAPSATTQCQQCGHDFPIKPRTISKEEGQLIEAQRKKEERKEQGKANSLAELQAIGRLKGRKPGWAYHVWEARQRKRGVA